MIRASSPGCPQRWPRGCKRLRQVASRFLCESITTPDTASARRRSNAINRTPTSTRSCLSNLDRSELTSAAKIYCAAHSLSRAVVYYLMTQRATGKVAGHFVLIPDLDAIHEDCLYS